MCRQCCRIYIFRMRGLFFSIRPDIISHYSTLHLCIENTYREVACVVFSITIEILNAKKFSGRIGFPHLFTFTVHNLANFNMAATSVAVARLRTK